MRVIFVMLCMMTISVFGQSQAEFMKTMTIDSVFVFNGEKEDQSDYALILGYTKTADALLDAIIEAHDETGVEVERTASSVVIKNTSKPGWTYGAYNVYIEVISTPAHTLIKIHHTEYNSEENYQIEGAAAFYQEIVNSLL